MACQRILIDACANVVVSELLDVEEWSAIIAVISRALVFACSSSQAKIRFCVTNAARVLQSILLSVFTSIGALVGR